MTTPYNTGKVKIGHAYTYTQKPRDYSGRWSETHYLLDKPASFFLALLCWLFTVSACIAFAGALVYFLSN